MQLKIIDLGLIDFKKAWQLQKQVFADVKTGLYNCALILCQHHPVITLGRLADKENILAAAPELKAKGIQVYETERGGDVTYHGPGQLTVYPIFNLNFLKKDIHWFLRQLEEIVIAWLSDFGIKSQRRAGLTGVWIGERKIASVGIAIRDWITFHGLSINIKKQDLENFSFIRPCGMNIEMTSLEAVLDRGIEVQGIKENLIHYFREGTR